MPPITYQDLLRQAAEKVQAAEEIQAKADAESRDLTAEEIGQIDTALADRDKLMTQAEARKKVSAARSSLDVPAPKLLLPEEIHPEGMPRKIPAEARDHEEERRSGFRHQGEFFRAVYLAGVPGRTREIDPRLIPLAAVSGMGMNQGEDGAFLVPPSFSQTIWDGLNDPTQSLLALVDSYPIEGESLTFNANAETARTVGNRYGGIRGYWIAEAEKVTGSRPKFRQLKLEPQELGVFIYVTDKLLKHTNALGAYLTRAATDEINFLVGDAFINGSGAGQPKGMLKSGAMVTVAAEGSQTADTFLAANAVKMWARLHPRSRANAVWFINPDVEPHLWLLNIVVKNVAGSENVGAAAALIYNPQNQTLMGRPVIPIEYCPTVGDVGDVILCDPKGYAAGYKSGIEEAMSIHLRFDYAETAFRWMFAIDGQTWLASPLNPAKGSSTLSTVIVLAAR